MAAERVVQDGGVDPVGGPAIAGGGVNVPVPPGEIDNGMPNTTEAPHVHRPEPEGTGQAQAAQGGGQILGVPLFTLGTGGDGTDP